MSSPASRAIGCACVVTAAVHHDERASIKRQITRMLRVDDVFTDWYRIHSTARRQKFGRLFRSPTFFEDIVKTITSCNVAWPNTRRMNRAVVPTCRRRRVPHVQTARQRHTRATEENLQGRLPGRAHRAVGTRTSRQANSISTGLRSRNARRASCTTDCAPFMASGPYAAANLCQLLGHYDRLAIDHRDLSPLLRDTRRAPAEESIALAPTHRTPLRTLRPLPVPRLLARNLGRLRAIRRQSVT